MSTSLWPHGLQHARLPCPSPTPRAYSNSCRSSWWCHPTISSSVFPFSSCLQSFPVSRFFSNESVIHIRWPKNWSFRFSIRPSSEYSGLISFCQVWYPCSLRDSQESSPTPRFKSINSLCLTFVNLINMCLGVFHLGFILFGILWVSWTWVIISFPILGKFSTIISSSIFSWSFFCLPLPGLLWFECWGI